MDTSRSAPVSVGRHGIDRDIDGRGVWRRVRIGRRGDRRGRFREHAVAQKAKRKADVEHDGANSCTRSRAGISADPDASTRAGADPEPDANPDSCTAPIVGCRPSPRACRW